MWINDSYDHALHYTFESLNAEMRVIVWDNFDLWKQMKFKGDESKRCEIHNQEEIFRSLVKWGFIEI